MCVGRANWSVKIDLLTELLDYGVMAAQQILILFE